jgi:hypothetical protein
MERFDGLALVVTGLIALTALAVWGTAAVAYVASRGWL